MANRPNDLTGVSRNGLGISLLMFEFLDHNLVFSWSCSKALIKHQHASLGGLPS